MKHRVNHGCACSASSAAASILTALSEFSTLSEAWAAYLAADERLGRGESAKDYRDETVRTGTILRRKNWNLIGDWTLKLR